MLLGGGVLAPEIEDVLAEMSTGERRDARVRAELLGHEVECRLVLVLHSVEPPPEEAVAQLHFNAFRNVPAVPHSQERHNFVAQLVASRAPASLADVGCGDGKILEHLITSRAPVGHMVGVDTTERVLRRGGRRVARAIDAARAADAAYTPPPVELLTADLRQLHVACEAIVMVEVIEHLDPWVLAEVGPALLGRCAPRWLLVTTPNKEYNLNFIQPPADWEDGLGPPPPPGSYPVRNADHRFEWTRAEFRAWAEALAETYHYTARFDGIGGGPMDEVVPYGVWRGGGPQTQAVLFTKREAPAGRSTGTTRHPSYGARRSPREAMGEPHDRLRARVFKSVS